MDSWLMSRHEAVSWNANGERGRKNICQGTWFEFVAICCDFGLSRIWHCQKRQSLSVEMAKAWFPATAMRTVYSAFSGETLTVVDDCTEKTTREIKQAVAVQTGIPRFRQRFLLESGPREILDEEPVASAVKVQLVVLEFELPEAEEDQRMIDACLQNDPQTLENLLQHPRTPNVTDADGKTLLHHAAENGHMESMGLLLEAGADKDLATLDTGATALHLAFQNAQAEVVRLLIEARADSNRARTDTGETPMYLAVSYGFIAKIVQLCLSRLGLTAAKPELTLEQHQSFARPRVATLNLFDCWLRLRLTVTKPDLIREKHQSSVGPRPDMSDVKIVRLLVDAAADTNKARTDTGESPMHVAAQNAKLGLRQWVSLTVSSLCQLKNQSLY